MIRRGEEGWVDVVGLDGRPVGERDHPSPPGDHQGPPLPTPPPSPLQKLMSFVLA